MVYRVVMMLLSSVDPEVSSMQPVLKRQGGPFAAGRP